MASFERWDSHDSNDTKISSGGVDGSELSPFSVELLCVLQLKTSSETPLGVMATEGKQRDGKLDS